MLIPLQITFRGIRPSAACEWLIRRRSVRIERFHRRITRCHVIIDVPHRHHKKGRLFEVHLDITTPSAEIAVSRNHRMHSSHAEFDAAIRDAFDAATRQLESARTGSAQRG